MLKTTIRSILITALIAVILDSEPKAQLIQDLSRQIEVPNISNINSSETHLYILSESEGLVVFRAYKDSLQWLYSSTGMQERGHLLESDIRFAYLFGNNRRLTVIEPTSVLGVYSSTILPSRPLVVQRIGVRLFTAMNNGNLGYLNLETAESVDSDLTIIEVNDRIVDLASDNLNVLYALTENSEILIFEIDEDNISKDSVTATDRRIDRIFLTGGELIGTDQSGNLYLISSDGITRRIAQISEPVERLSYWDNLVIVRTESKKIWVGSLEGNFNLWKSDEGAGNLFTTSSEQFWITEFNSIAPVHRVESDPDRNISSTLGNDFKLKEIHDVILPFPRTLILPIEFESDVDMSQTTISYTAPFHNARIRGNTLYWQPLASQTGRHQVTVTANSADGRSDSQSFIVDLRTFNSPPQFTPSRPVSIPVGELFDFQITAVDPDGPDRDLIRYIGVDMPEGADLNESTGLFSWEPSIRQVGEHRFQVIATDQFGAASSQNFTINVIEIVEADPDLGIDID